VWSPNIHAWRGAVLATWFAGLIVHAGGAGAQTAAVSCGVDDILRIAAVDRASSGAAGFQPIVVISPTPVLLAQIAAPAPTRDLPVDTSVRPLPAAPDAANDAAAAGSPGGFEWGLAPLRWGGALTADLRRVSSGDGPRRLQQFETANIKGASYIWQPWFAQVSGGLGFLNSRERQSGSAGVTAEQPQQTSAGAVTGNGDVTLFPVSRFPFNAYFDVSDSRASGEQSVNDFSNTRLGMRQSYRPLSDNANYSVSINRSTLESASFGRDTVDALAASMNRNYGSQTFDLSGSHAGNTRSNTGESTALSNLSARHSYRPEPELAVESLANWSRADFHLLSTGVPSDNRSRFAQANSFVTWRPEEDSPLFLTGGARIFRSAIASNAGESESHTLSGNVGATYALSRQTSLSGSVTATDLVTDATSRMLTTETANVSHVSEPFGISGFAYSWNAGANIGNQNGAVEGSRQILGGQLGHGLVRGLTMNENSQVNFGLGQSIGTTFDSVTGHAQTLSHNGSASWRLSQDAATSSFVSLLGSDMRTTGINENHFQMINFQVSGQVQISRSSSAAANLTLQGVRHDTPTTPSAGTDSNSSGNLSYFHLRAFDVARLRYSALYGINETQFKTRLQGDVTAPRERVSQSFEQRLDYNLGRIAMRLSMRTARVEGRRDALIFFRIIREFGNF